MDITITLGADDERFVRAQAEKRGVAPERLAETMVADALERERKAALASDLFRKWAEEDKSNSDDDTFETIVAALNQERKGYRQHFPTELKGKTW